MKKKIVLSFTLIFIAVRAFSLEYVSLREESFHWQKGRMNRINMFTTNGLDASLRLNAFDDIENIDLLLNFGNTKEINRYPYFLIEEGVQLSSLRHATGGQSIAFSARNYLELKPLQDSLFSSDDQNNDFTIGFWLNPLRLGEGEIIFNYRSPIEQNGQHMWQSIIAFIEMKRVVWRFENVFFNESGESLLIELVGKSIEKGQWSHHAVSFDTHRGFIQLLNDNQPIDSRYTNFVNYADALTLPAVFQYNEDQSIRIGEFYGYLDAFLISRQFMDRIALDAFNRNGHYISAPIAIGDKVIDSIEMDVLNEQYSATRMYFRAGNSAKILMNLSEDEGWYEVNNQSLAELRAREYTFLQIRTDFFAGEGRRSTPILRDVKIFYRNLPRPAKPGFLNALKEGNTLRITWQPVIARNVYGYKLYFGTESGEYLGVLAQGTSPIDVDMEQSIVLQGLKPGTMYYFALVTYDERGRESAFSQEMVVLY